MANQGLDSELINATEVSISDGTDTYIKLQELTVNFGHPEFREDAVDGVHYFYGAGDHFIEGTLLATVPELTTFTGFTEIDSNGAPTSKNWVLVYTGESSGTTNTMTLTGTMAPLFRTEKLATGAVKARKLKRTRTKRKRT